MIEDATQEPAPGDNIPLTPEISQEATAPAKNKGGRPFAKIDWDRVETMLRSGCSGIEIADALGLSKITLYDRYLTDFKDKGDRFEDWKRACQASTRELLRQAQLKSAMGYTYEKTEIEYKTDKEGKRIEIKRKTSTMKVPENPALLIFLGKNMLGQSDAPEGGDTGFGNIPNYQLVGDDEEESETPALPSGDGPDDDVDDSDDDTDIDESDTDDE